MTSRTLFGLFAAGGLAAIVSCDNGSTPSTSGLAGESSCQIGSFQPVGISDCVFPSTDVNGQPIGVSDNRCASGQPAIPPSCVSDSGQRAYLWATDTCAPGYRFEPGSCSRNGGFAGSFGMGTAGASTGAAGVSGTAGFFPGEGTAGTGFAGGAGSSGVAGAGDFGTGTGGGDATDGGVGAGGLGGTG